jgi:hypothetical protein
MTYILPCDVFGKGDADKIFRDLKIKHHPDHGGSAELFKSTQELYESWKNPTVIGPYKVYKMTDGDLTTVYGNLDVVVKVAKHPAANKFLKDGLDTLNKVRGDIFFDKLLPVPITSFSINTNYGADLTVQVFNREKTCSLADVLKRYTGGIDIRDAAWMLNRLMTILGYLHSKNLVAANLTPEHFLINCETHGGTLLGWSNIFPSGERPRYLTKKYIGRAYYSDEYEKKTMSSKIFDVCLVKQIAIKLIRKEDVQFVFDMSAIVTDNAWELHDKFNEVLTKKIGKRTFRQFNM